MLLGLPVVIGTVVVIYRSFTSSAPAATPPERNVLPTVAPFDRVGFRVDDNPQVRCALLAATPAAQVEGMQGKHTLFGYDALVFAFPEATTVHFTNHFVPIDLSIGWYDAAGVLVDETTMAACPSGQECPEYAAKDPFSYAVETPVGGLAGLGLTHAGAVLHVGGGCPA
ncbi:MAG TPA: DUF192 domain-containing protein [Acidimicrobiales bacterium]|nr:DUF192 domain-containing protein [Acidimicrobiales bacterium]